MTDLPIALKLSRILRMLMIAMAALSAGSLGAMLALRVVAEDLRGTWLPSVILTESLNVTLSDYRLAESAALMADDPDRRDAAIEAAATLARQADALFADYASLAGGADERTLLATARDRWDAYRRAGAVYLHDAAPEDTRALHASFVADHRLAFDEARAALVRIVESERAGASAEADLGDKVFWIALLLIVMLIGAAILVVRHGQRIARTTIAAPITALHDLMGRLAAGDTTIVVDGTERRDEIGLMARAVEVFRGNTQRLHGLAGEIRTIIEALATAAQSMRQGSGSVYRIADRTAEMAMGAAHSAEESSRNIAQISTAIVEFNASIDEIARQSAHSGTLAAETEQKVRETRTLVHELEVAAAGIGEVVSLITNVAEQTNLLALNATIEAARAGEAGRGFAVVASEVKTLAMQTGQATTDITARVESIRNAVQRSVSATDRAGAAVSAMSQTTAAIASAVQEQSAATADVARNVEEASGFVSGVSERVAGVQAATSHSRDAASDLDTAVRSLDAQRVQLERSFGDLIASMKRAA